MVTNPRPRVVIFALVMALIAGACGSSTSDETATDDQATAETDTTEASDTTETAEDTSDDDSAEPEASAEDESDTDAGDDETAGEPSGDVATNPVDVGLFFDGAVVGDVTTEECTLSGGATTTCYRITVSGDPVTYETGPFCPTSITDSADEGGIWFDGNGVYELDGDFIAGLAELYDDENWMMFDEEGNVLVTETAEEFDLAARPDVDPSLQNHCVEGRLEWLDDGEPVTTTVVIPVEPVLADGSATTRGNLGVTLDGVVIAQSAPVDAILAAYTIAAFDDCGGHYNPVDGYHLHGAVGCSELESDIEGETPQFAYAMDGFPVHSPLDDADSADLDECGGHEHEELGYHYHANSAEQNLVITCLVGQTVAAAEDAAGGRPDGPPPGRDDEG